MKLPIKIDAGILEFATDNQRRVLEKALELGYLQDADKALGLSRGYASAIHKAVLKRAAKAGYAPEAVVDRPTMAGFELKRVSTLARNALGEPQWQIQEQSKVQQANSLRDFVKGLCQQITQAEPTPASREQYSSDLLPAIFIGDAHIGMRAYGKETKHHNFDTSIATQQLRDAVDYLSSRAEPAEQGMIIDVGDYTHSDGHADTTTAGTPLDVDTRYHSTMFQAAMCMRYMIGKMLEKCRRVTVVIARGNHNDNSSVAIQLMLAFFYEKEPRVNILDTESYYHYVEYGAWLLGITHGNKQKAEALAGSMARDMAQAWGRTTHRMWITGHYHKDAVKTLPGVKHKIVGALPPPDSWHSSHGFSGDGEMEMMTFRREGGVHSSHVYNIPRPIVEPDVKL